MFLTDCLQISGTWGSYIGPVIFALLRQIACDIFCWHFCLVHINFLYRFKSTSLSSQLSLEKDVSAGLTLVFYNLIEGHSLRCVNIACLRYDLSSFWFLSTDEVILVDELMGDKSSPWIDSQDFWASFVAFLVAEKICRFHNYSVFLALLLHILIVRRLTSLLIIGVFEEPCFLLH